MSLLQRCGALLGVVLLLLSSPRLSPAHAQESTLVALIASTSTVTAGGAFHLTGMVQTVSTTPVTLSIRLDLTPGLASVVVLESEAGDCSSTPDQCVVTLTAAMPASVTITVSVRDDLAPETLIEAVLEASGDGSPSRSTPVTVRVQAAPISPPTATATATATPPALSAVPTATATTDSPMATATREATSTLAPTATTERTPSPTSDARTLPDHCEPNDTPERACALPLEAISGPFTLVPEGDSDYYQIDLGQPTGQPATIFVRGPAELALITTVLAGDDRRQVGLIADGAISTTLASDLGGPLLLHVESRATEPTSGASYRVEARRATGLPPTPPPQPRGSVPLPDALENNWTGAAAPVIGLDVAYDLNFTCPVVWGCVGGDHDYLRVPVKQGLDYILATFDLGPGVDTTIDLFWQDEQQPLGSNDDATPGTSLLSVIRWRAPADGMALLRIAPRTGKDNPLVMDAKAGSYRFAIALRGGAFGRELEERIAAQTLVTPTPAPPLPMGDEGDLERAAPPAAAQPAVPTSLTSAIPAGPAQIIHDTALHLAPEARSTALITLRADTVVTLTGQTNNLWVQVATDQSVLPGWVAAQDVQRITAGSTPFAESDLDPAAPPASTMVPNNTLGTVATATPPIAGGASLAITPLSPLPPAPAVVAPRVPFTLVVLLQAASTGATGPTPTPAPEAGLDGVRVQLVDALGDVLAEGVTRDGGRLALTRDLPPDSTVWVRVPAIGVTAAIPTPRPPTFVILVPTSRSGGTP